MTTQNKPSPLEVIAAREALWNQGVIHWLLHPGQKDLYDSYNNTQEKVLVWNCSRRLGKSYTLCIIAIETCLKKQNSLVKYCCAKQVDAKNIIRPLIREIIQSCPKEIRPEFKAYEKAYVFPNGSRIELSGLDAGRAESLRGGSADLGIIDEAGLVSDLSYILTSIILPTTTTTKGKIILASTPPKSSTHEYVDFVNEARIKGTLVTKTIYDNPLIDKEELEKIIKQCGGINSVSFRREYLCQMITDINRAVIPEFTKELQQEIVKEWPKPPFYDAYVSMDLGLKDLTAVLFAYYDFKADKVIIEDEFSLNGQKFNTAILADNIRRKEEFCFSDPLTKEMKPPYLRVSDNNLIVINDLYQLHGLHFLPTRKDDRDAALNNLRMKIQEGKIIINPRCKTLIIHLEAATWNKARTELDRSPDNGHYDFLPALSYLIRNIQFNKNPYPAYYGRPNGEDRYVINRTENNYKYASQFSKIYNIKK